MLLLFCILIALVWAPAGTVFAQGRPDQVTELASRLSLEQAKREALEVRVNDLAQQTQAVQTVAVSSIASLELAAKKHVETVVYFQSLGGVLLGGIFLLLGFVGYRTWRDVQVDIRRIREARENAEAQDRKWGDKVKFDEMSTLVKLYNECHQPEEALSLTKEIMRLEAMDQAMERQHVYFNRAISLKRLGRYSEAYINARNVTEILPRLAKVWYNAGCYAALASKEDREYVRPALDCLKRALELSPKYTRTFALGTVVAAADTYDAGVQRTLPRSGDKDLDPIREEAEFKRMFGLL